MKIPINRAVGDGFLSEYFIMRTVINDKKECNMQLEIFEETVKVDGYTTMVVKIPCATSILPVKAGDELVLHRAATKQAPKERDVLVTIDAKGASNPKRARVDV